MRVPAWLSGAILSLCASLPLSRIGAARADAFPSDDARVLSADPNVPVFGLGYRVAARATFGSPIRPLSGAAGLQVAIIPLLELHNSVGSSEVIPFENWRGRLELHAGWRLARPAYTLTGWLGLEHESDHPTVWQPPYPTFSYFTLNSVVTRIQVTWPLGNVALSAAAIERFYVDACTSVTRQCRRAFGDGSTAFEQGLEGVVDGSPSGEYALRPFGALALSWMSSSDRAHGEKRLALRAGLRLRQRAVGLWQAYAVALFGNDVGLFRNESARQVGGGAAFSF